MSHDQALRKGFQPAFVWSKAMADEIADEKRKLEESKCCQ